MGISRDSRHKRSATGAKRPQYRKKRKFELGRQPAMTKIGPKRVHTVRVRGGNLKYRAMRLETGNFSWGSEHSTCKTRILNVVYNASNNELVRTNTLVKGSIIQIDATPFRQWFEKHYGLTISQAKHLKNTSDPEHADKKTVALTHGKNAALDAHFAEQFAVGRLYARVASRPGQCGRCDGYLLEGKELDFYVKKLKSKGKNVAK